MEQKRVSFKVAKAIKEAGYPQDICGYTEEGYKVNPFIPSNEKTAYSAPYYLEVWLWLEKEKGIYLQPVLRKGKFRCEFFRMGQNYWHTYGFLGIPAQVSVGEAIARGIDYIVDNDLIR